MRLRSLLITVVATALGTALFSPPAHAVSWGTIYASYNNQLRTDAWGNFYNQGYQYATNQFWLNDMANDGNNSYGHTDFYWWGQNSSCGTDSLGNPLTCWYGGSRISTGEYTYSNTPVTKYMSKGLQGTATLARGKSTACVQLGWPVPDHCASSAYPTFGY
jgi:hypothetical protein